MSRKAPTVKAKYAVRLAWDPDYEGYVASVVELPGCYSQGKTEEEALANVREAIELHIEGLVLHGDPVPAPTSIRLVEVLVPSPH